MFPPWLSLPLVVLGLALSTFASTSRSFVNTDIVRAIDLGGSLVQVTTTYTIKALEPDSDDYTIALSPEEKKQTSWIQARLKGEQKALALEDLGYNDESQSYLLRVDLPTPLAVGDTAKLVLETVQTHATYPWPEVAGQEDDQALKYKTMLFVISPYPTSLQRTKIRSPTPRIISYTVPDNMHDFTFEDPVTKSGATLTYGPYKSVGSISPSFIRDQQRPIVIHYYYDQPVLEVTKLKRAAEISHWGANLNIQDEIHLHNAGPALKGQFARIVHQSQMAYHKPAPHVLTTLTLRLPPGIHDAYYYDLVGNVSTSKLQIAPSSSKRNSILDLRPRYPLMGGWNYSFTLGWDSPLADSAVWDKAIGRYIVGVPVMTAIPGAVVNEAEVKIILPEGATDVEAFTPFAPVSNSSSIHTTYLDTTGRPVLTFKYHRLIERHAKVIYVSYKVSLLAHLKKPLAVATALIGVFVIALGGRRMDLRIHKKS